MTPAVVVMLCVHCLLVYLAALTASTIAVWVTSLLLLSTLNFSPGTQLIVRITNICINIYIYIYIYIYNPCYAVIYIVECSRYQL